MILSFDFILPVCLYIHGFIHCLNHLCNSGLWQRVNASWRRVRGRAHPSRQSIASLTQLDNHTLTPTTHIRRHGQFIIKYPERTQTGTERSLQASHRKDPARPICKMIQTFVIWRLMRPIKKYCEM